MYLFIFDFKWIKKISCPENSKGNKFDRRKNQRRILSIKIDFSYYLINIRKEKDLSGKNINSKQNHLEPKNIITVRRKGRREIEDEEIQSEEEENPQEFSDEEPVQEDLEENELEEDIVNTGVEGDNQTELEKLDKEIKRMEKKLGINKDRGKMQFKKRLAQENYDEDFLDFLDHIDNVVVEEKTKINPFSSIDKKKKKIKGIRSCWWCRKSDR